MAWVSESCVSWAFSSQTDYLVLGTFSSDGWLYSTHGAKIQKAMDLKKEGRPIVIIGEQHWLSALDQALA